MQSHLDPTPRPFAAPDPRHAALSVAAERRARGEAQRGSDDDAAAPTDARPCLPAALSWVPDASGPLPARHADHLQARSFLRMVSAGERFIVDALLRTAACRRADGPLLEEALLRAAEDKLAQARQCARLDGPLAPDLGPETRMPCRLPVPRGPARAWVTWALAGWIALAAQAHHRAALREARLAACWRDAFAARWQQASRHVVITESLWFAEDARLDAAERDAAVRLLLDTVGRIDRLLRREAADDARGWPLPPTTTARSGRRAVQEALHAAARRQHLAAGWLEPRFQSALARLLPAAALQAARERLATVTDSTP